MNPKLLYKISEILVKFAKEGNVIQYGQVSKQLEKLSPPIVIPPLKLNEPLGAISEMCMERGLPPLSAIVVNQDTYLPGDGFFTYVAGLLGYPDLKGNEWEAFYEEQKEAVFQVQNWDGFLHSFYEKTAPRQKANKQTNHLLSPEHGEALDKQWNDTVNKKQSVFNEKAFIHSLRDREYARQNGTSYYILTAKCSEDEASLEYRVLLVDGHKIVRKKRVRTAKKKQWLAAAKRRGLDLLFDYQLAVSAEDVSLVHYRPNRPEAETWEQEASDTFEKLFHERQKKYRETVVEEDITAELAQEDTFYKDGAAHPYYGTRYERDPRNRLRAIDIHGLSCAACGFNFEEVYGERGKDFIEVHHIKPISTLNEKIEINPEKDLVPVCSNCHRMLHRKRDHVLTVEELRALIRQ